MKLIRDVHNFVHAIKE